MPVSANELNCVGACVYHVSSFGYQGCAIFPFFFTGYPFLYFDNRFGKPNNVNNTPTFGIIAPYFYRFKIRQGSTDLAVVRVIPFKICFSRLYSLSLSLGYRLKYCVK